MDEVRWWIEDHPLAMLAITVAAVIVAAASLLLGRGEEGPSPADTLATMAIASGAAEAQESSAEAADADAKAAVRTAQTAMETYATDNGGEYSGAGTAELVAIESTLADVELSSVSAFSGSYVIGVTSETGTEFTIGREPDGSTTYSCSAPGTGGCPPGGVWP